MSQDITTQPLTRPTRALCARAQCIAAQWGGCLARPSQRFGHTHSICLLACLTFSNLATQAQDTPTETLKVPDKQHIYQAAFSYTLGPLELTEDAPTFLASSLTLVLDTQPPGDAQQPQADTWMLDVWTPRETTEHATELNTPRSLTLLDNQPRFRTYADRWTRSVYSQDAGQLTPLTPGQEVLSWELVDGFTLAGVGSRRLFTDRSRAFVLSAEAGFDLSPHAGLQFGYELLQTSAGGALPDNAGGDSLFARFQLRF